MKLYEFFSVPVDKTGKEFKTFKKQSQEEKQKTADEVFCYILDHDLLHKEFVLPFVSKIKNKISDPNIDRNRFAKSWLPMVNKGCTLYHKKMKLNSNPKELFDQKTREDLCKRLADQFIDDLTNDEYHVGDYSK